MKYNEKELREMVSFIQRQYYNNQPYKQLLEDFANSIDFPNVEQFFFNMNYSDDYIVNRILHYRPVQPGELGEEKLIELVDKVMRGDGEEWEIDNWIDMLKTELGSDLTDYIFWSDKEWTAEELVRELLSKRNQNT